MYFYVAGDSAGGNLAAAVSLKLRDEGFAPKIKLQVLLYPALQCLDFQLPSYKHNHNGPLTTTEMLAYSYNQYMDGKTDKIPVFVNNSHVSASAKNALAKTHLNLDRLPKTFLEGFKRPSLDFGDEKIWSEVKDTLMNPYFSPLVAESLADLPTAYVFTAEHDVLRDDGILYADRLREAGNKVTHVNPDMGIHGMMSYGEFIPEARPFIDEMTMFIKNNLGERQT